MEEELDMRTSMAQEVLERGFPDFTIPYVEAAYFTGSDYLLRLPMNPVVVICTPRFGIREGDEEFFKAFRTFLL